jgi:protein-disulfide isomerase
VSPRVVLPGVSENDGRGRRSARERLRQERERARAREKRRRALIVAAIAVTVLGIAVAVGIVGSQTGGGGGQTGPVTAPRGATGKDNLAIAVGKSAPSTLTVYEDFRCPACKQFETVFRGTIHGLQDKGQLRTEYHLVTVIDANLGGSGSLHAGNAAACAQDVGRFQAYHDVLYRDQPPEQDDAFAKNDHLIKLAGKVPGLATDAFKKCVEDGVHNGWVKKSTTAFTDAGYQGTPTVLFNGKSVYGNPKNPLTPEKLTKMVADAAKGS